MDSEYCCVEAWGSEMRRGRDREREGDGRGSAEGLRGQEEV